MFAWNNTQIVIMTQQIARIHTKDVSIKFSAQRYAQSQTIFKAK